MKLTSLKPFKIIFFASLLFVYLLPPLRSTLVYATQDTTTNYNKEELKQDYRAFLQQLKSLNAQYKEVTGEISKVVKEEGVPTWDMGDSNTTKNEEKKTIQDLEGGVYLRDTVKEMQFMIDLPGYKKDTIKLSFQGTGKLTINAMRKLDYMTRSYERTLDLPTPGDQKTTTATYEDGVLTVKVPKVAAKDVVIPIR
jgi:HSP20 family molecular chaperone IbpA